MSYTLTLIPGLSTIYTGDVVNVSFLITNENLLYDGRCAYILDSQNLSLEFLIPARDSNLFNVSVHAPAWGSGTGSVQHTITAYCYEPDGDINIISRNISFNLTYSENPQYLASLASAAINSAQSAVNSAQSSMDSVQIEINNAKMLDADVSLAVSMQSSAKNSIQTAKSKLYSANGYYAASNYTQAAITASEAGSYASDALKIAENARSSAIQAIAEAPAAKAAAKIAEDMKAKTEQKRTELKLYTAQTNYNDAVDAVNKVNEAIKLLSSAVVDTSEFSKDLETISFTLVDAKAELDRAKTKYEMNELNESKAHSAGSLNITEKDIIILKHIQNKIVQAAMDKSNDKFTLTSKNYSIAVKRLEESKTRNAGEYIAKKERLDSAKKSLDNASALIVQAKSYADNIEYYDAVISLKGAFIQLEKAESLSGEIKPAPVVPSFEAMVVLVGLSTVYLVIKKSKR